MSQSFVDSFTHLTGRPLSDRALPLLQKIASLVKPIMRNHGWRLPVLAEFFPDNESLVGLNVNGGQKILLRLRPAWAPNTFYDEEQLVAVMLHELTHNVHGPHDDKFYKFLSELEDEYNALKRSGYAGEGFFTPGQRLGAGVSHNVPPHNSRAKAIEAAERRKVMAGIMGKGSGQRLGGRLVGVNHRQYSLRELAAQAAERRIRDEKSCATRHGADVWEEADKAARDSVEDKATDLYSGHGFDPTPWLYDESTGLWEQRALESGLEWPCPTCTLLNPPLALQCSACLSQRSQDVPLPNSSPREQVTYAPPPGPPPPSMSSKPSGSAGGRAPPRIPPNKPVLQKKLPPPWLPPNKPNKDGAVWACPTCTLENANNVPQCLACLSERPKREADGWVCLTCGETGNLPDFWSCKFCGSIKQSSAVAL